MPSKLTPESLSFLRNIDDPEIAARLRETSRRVYGASGQTLFAEVARAVAETVDADYALVGIREPRDSGIFIRTLSFWCNGQLAENFEYPLAGTPCECVDGRDFRYYSTESLAQFTAPPPPELRVNSYIGLPLVSSDNTTLGVIVAMSTRPAVKPVWAEAMLRLFADRTVSEIERHNTSRALENAEEAYRVIFEANEDPIFVLDVDSSRIVAVNQKACDVYGYSREEFAQISPRDVSSGEPPFTEVDAANWMAHARQTGFAEFEWHRRNRDGSLHWDEVRLKSVTIGGQPRILAFSREITERKAAEAALRVSEEQLRQAQKMEALGQLTGGIAHDFNNILTSTIGYIDLVQELAKEIKPEHRRYLQRAKRAGKRAQDLVQQMLTYSRGGRGQPRPVEVSTLVTEVVSMLEATLPSSIQIEIESETEVPRIFLDPVNATQALMNLCINARDAMAGHGVLRIHSERRQFDLCRCSSCKQPVAGNYVAISVTDTGAGIDSAILERIFEPFFSTKAQGNGSGMGLATTHGIVHQIGGHIVVDNQAGGTTFALLFPSARAPGIEDAEIQDFAPSADSQALRGNVLVVDDNPAVGEFMRDLLRSWGLDVTVQQSALRAEQDFCGRPQAFDCAVIDQTMPECSGLELARALLAKQAAFPIVLYTGFSDAIDEEIVRRAGCVALLRKPVDAPALKSLLRTALQK